MPRKYLKTIDKQSLQRNATCCDEMFKIQQKKKKKQNNQQETQEGLLQDRH